MVRHLFLWAGFCLAALPAWAQPTPDSLLAQIDSQVWIPFVESYNSGDTEAFMALHAPQVLRIPQDEQSIFPYDAYREQVQQANDQSRKEHIHRSIEIRFETRIATETHALETGYYCVRSGPTGTEWEFYGYFTVAMQQIAGRWRIILDTDTERHATKEAFFQATPLQME